MNALPNSTSDSTSKEATEELADLTLNHDEVLDLTLALGALGGLRHSAACDASERSQRRYDDRNHRLHESRMKELGMNGDEKPETDEMSQQVLIRSPVTHNHYQPQQPGTPTNGLSPLAKWLIAAAIGTGTLGGGAGLWSMFQGGGDTVINQPIEQADGTGIGLVPPGPPVQRTTP